MADGLADEFQHYVHLDGTAFLSRPALTPCEDFSAETFCQDLREAMKGGGEKIMLIHLFRISLVDLLIIYLNVYCLNLISHLANIWFTVECLLLNPLYSVAKQVMSSNFITLPGKITRFLQFCFYHD